MEKLVKALKDNWPAAFVIAVLIAGFVATAIFASSEVQGWLFGAEGLVATLFGIWMQSPRDRRRERERRESSTPPPAGPALALLFAVGLAGSVPACTMAEMRTALTAAELVRKIGCDVLCPDRRGSCPAPEESPAPAPESTSPEVS